jgi:crotonobetainyl-CoA:carnitine CoA-transferase CaiB-like acyl-CoA transferase
MASLGIAGLTIQAVVTCLDVIEGLTVHQTNILSLAHVDLRHNVKPSDPRIFLRCRMNHASPHHNLPLAGLRVVEFTHMVMGPTCGMLLADMGAEVIKVEPIDGDRTRHLLGAGTGFFPMFNRNKKSIAIDLHKPEGADVARKLAASADIVAENFKPGTMGKYGLDYAALSLVNPRLIYVTHKGFLPGPYENRTALDEVVQMMGGLAYMTGRPGDPLRAGTSVNDIMGGLFGAIGALGALIQRGITGRGPGSAKCAV